MKAGRIALLLCLVFSYAQSLMILNKDLLKGLGFKFKLPFSIEEAVLGRLSVKSRSGRWVSDNELEYFEVKTRSVKLFDASKSKSTVLVPPDVLREYNVTDYEISPDNKYVLMTFDALHTLKPLKKTKFAIHSLSDGKHYVYSEYVQAVQWSPKVNNVVFVKDNNIYVIRHFNLTEVKIIQITKDGKPGSVFNGVADWIYEEEILRSPKAFWFSPEGEQIAYATFFDNPVTNVSIQEYGEPMNYKVQYTKQIVFPYPKPGTGIPTYSLSHVSFRHPKKISVITKSSEGRELFHKLMWNGTHNIIYLVTNRVQNMTKVYSYSVESQVESSLDFLNEVNPKGWSNTNLPHLSKDGSRYLRLEGGVVKNKGKFQHVILTHRNRTVLDLTPGPSEALSILHWNEQDRLVYYLATENKSATATQLYVVREYSKSKPVCMSCGIKSPEGRHCKDVSASFSKNGLFIILSCNGPDPRIIYVYKNRKTLGEPLLILQDNSSLRKRLSRKLMPEVVSMTVGITDKFKADVRLLLPPNADRSGRTRYPFVTYVYGGPASKAVKDEFKLHWGLYMSTNLSIVYGMIDGRNTLRKGEDFLFAGYRALGTVEIKDQISVIMHLQKTLPYIDPERTGIWGWSYGGYLTTKILEKDTRNVFKGGIAVSPVADWMYYDAVYTEKYMGMPEENKLAYERASVLKNVSNLRHKKYFLIHGNGDNNVHYQNAMLIAKKLENENIPFELMSYPDEDHGLKNVRKHFYYTMSRFWKRCFSLP